MTRTKERHRPTVSQVDPAVSMRGRTAAAGTELNEAGGREEEEAGGTKYSEVEGKEVVEEEGADEGKGRDFPFIVVLRMREQMQSIVQTTSQPRDIVCRAYLFRPFEASDPPQRVLIRSSHKCKEGSICYARLLVQWVCRMSHVVCAQAKFRSSAFREALSPTFPLIAAAPAQQQYGGVASP